MIYADKIRGQNKSSCFIRFGSFSLSDEEGIESGTRLQFADIIVWKIWFTFALLHLQFNFGMVAVYNCLAPQNRAIFCKKRGEKCLNIPIKLLFSGAIQIFILTKVVLTEHILVLMQQVPLSVSE